MTSGAAGLYREVQELRRVLADTKADADRAKTALRAVRADRDRVSEMLDFAHQRLAAEPTDEARTWEKLAKEANRAAVEAMNRADELAAALLEARTEAEKQRQERVLADYRLTDAQRELDRLAEVNAKPTCGEWSLRQQYRCTEAPNHQGNHFAVKYGQSLATWPSDAFDAGLGAAARRDGAAAAYQDAAKEVRALVVDIDALDPYTEAVRDCWRLILGLATPEPPTTEEQQP